MVSLKNKTQETKTNKNSKNMVDKMVAKISSKQTDVITISNLSYSYDSKSNALDNLTLSIPKGKKTVFLGPNGAGKSTLFLHFNGVNKPDSGKVFFEGEELKYDSKSLTKLRENVCLVFQNPDDQIFSTTVEEDVAFGPLNLDLPQEEVHKRVDQALLWVGLLDLKKRPTQQLSFGQRKRVALAGALAMNPKVLIMDEPTAGLDTEMVHELLELADELNHRGITVVMSTHDIETAYEWADEVKVILNGKLFFSGKPEALFRQSELLHVLGIIPPMAFLLNEQLNLRTGKSVFPYPKSFLELSPKLFSDNNSKNNKNGEIYLICVDEFKDKLDVKKLARKIHLKFKRLHKRAGVYGTVARQMVDKGLLDVHFRFHALEHGLFQASLGESFLLYTDSSLCSLVDKRANYLNKTLGLNLKVFHLHKKDLD